MGDGCLSVTVGICACGDERNLAPLLDSVLHEQELPESSEILVVCSECTEETVDAVRTRLVDGRVKLFLESKRTGKATAINRILSEAAGGVIVFVSADVLPNKGCFPALLSGMKERDVGIVCGKPIPTKDSGSTSDKLVQLLWRFHHRVFTDLNHSGLLTHASDVYCIRSGIVKRVPANVVNDDAYIAVMTKKHNWSIRYEPAAQVVMKGPSNVVEYYRQRRRIVFGHYQVRRLTGRFPQYLAYWALVRPTKILRLVCEEIRHERSLRIIATAFLLELVINVTGILDFVLGRSHVPWRVIASTKKGLGR